GIRDFHVTGVQTCALPISHYQIFIARPAFTALITHHNPRRDSGGAQHKRSGSRVMGAEPAHFIKKQAVYAVAWHSGWAQGIEVRSEERRVGKACTRGVGPA